MTNWADFPVIKAVAETGNLSAAAKKLGLSQPTVGRRVKAVEKHFGEALFTREPRGFVLTEFGRLIIAHVTSMEKQVQAMKNLSAIQDASMKGPVCITGTEGITSRWIPAIVQNLRYDHPGLSVHLRLSETPLNLFQREADIALRWFTPGHQKSLLARKVSTVTFGLFAAESYIQRRGMPKNARDLEHHDSINLESQADEPLWIRGATGHLKYLPQNTVFRSNNVTAVINALYSGYGIGAYPICITQLSQLPIVRILPEYTKPNDLWIVAHEELHRNNRIRTVFDYIVEAFRRDAPFFEKAAPSVFLPSAKLTHKPVARPN